MAWLQQHLFSHSLTMDKLILMHLKIGMQMKQFVNLNNRQKKRTVYTVGIMK